ncbi:ABC transporter ATP-binding protein [Paracoccus aestuariivivens]|uniref:ATP-binding cassette domain-containing protein n=1 Tax=Paracoccus aestuariivivens TaxID=1820333 RepID=A0A6L6J4B1_9RHOB|nr:ABC transporter ATP-binding protein [Paracoccus aestuariivivens]MTH76922.1 ATP-binding cassette domain-containing protein [Paracoccus aestuariivivens]
MSALLEVSGLSRRFGGLLAVNDVSFSVGQGAIVGLLGPNGSGKTTVLNMISGHLLPSGGDISLHGKRISGLGASRISKHGVARTFQLVRALPSLTVVENVTVALAFGRQKLWGVAARERAMGFLDQVGLAHRADHLAEDLTYIDQKRMELARALAADPELLLLDEWLAGLNPTELQSGIGLIRSLGSSGITILMVEHVMEAIRALCSQCVIMNAGVKIADAPTADALSDPAVITAYLGEQHA